MAIGSTCGTSSELDSGLVLQQLLREKLGGIACVCVWGRFTTGASKCIKRVPARDAALFPTHVWKWVFSGDGAGKMMAGWE